MFENVFFQWQNETLLKTIYPLREKKLRDFLVYYKEIDLWAENKNMAEDADAFEAEKEKYRKKQAGAIVKMVDLFYKQKDYFENREGVRTAYEEMTVTLEDGTIQKKFKTLDDTVLKKIESMHNSFEVYMPKVTSVRREKFFVLGQIQDWEKKLKQIMSDVAKQKLSEVAELMAKEELDQLKAFAASYDVIEKRKKELDVRQNKLLVEQSTIRTRIKEQQQKIVPLEEKYDEIRNDVKHLKSPPSIETIKEYFSVDHFLEHIRLAFPGVDNKLRSAFENLGTAVNLLLTSNNSDVRLSYLGKEIRQMNDLKNSYMSQINRYEEMISDSIVGSPKRLQLEKTLVELRDVKLKAVREELVELGDLKAAIEFMEKQWTDEDRADELKQKEDELNRVQKELDGEKDKLKKIVQDELEPINNELAVPDAEKLKRFAPTTDITVEDIVKGMAEEYRLSLEKLKHQQLLELVVDRFIAKPKRYPLWLQYMVIHFSGMRYASAHGSWADPRQLLVKLGEDETRVKAMQDSDVLEALRSFKNRENDPIPEWMWHEIVKLTDLRLTEAKDKSWETLRAGEWNKYSQIMNKWKMDNLTGWRKEHERTGRLVVTRAVCNEVAEHIQHLRGYEGAAGLTAKPDWYMGEEAKYQEDITPRAYFVKSKTDDDFKVGASILWLRFVQDYPNPWRVATPLTTTGGSELIPEEYRGRSNPGLNVWKYQVDTPIVRRRSVQREGRIGKETQYLRWMHEATVAEVAETAEGKVVLTFETALPQDDRRFSTIGVFKRFPGDLKFDFGEDAYNPAFVGFVPESQPPTEALEHMLDWNAILLEEKMTPPQLEEYREKYIRIKAPPLNYGTSPTKIEVTQATSEQEEKAYVAPESDGKVFEVLKWGDDPLVDLLGKTTEKADADFQAVNLAGINKLAGIDRIGQADFDIINQYQLVDYDYLLSLQHGQDEDVKKIMKWLVNHDGKGHRPYWMRGSDKLYFGPIVFGGQLVEVEAVDGVAREYLFDAKYPGRDSIETDQVFYKLKGLRRSEMETVTNSTHPYKIQLATELGKDNHYSERPRGMKIFHPVWDPRDWPCKPYGGALYIPKAFVKESVSCE